VCPAALAAQRGFPHAAIKNEKAAIGNWQLAMGR